MSVVITPSEQLEFHRPFTRDSKEYLNIKNTGSEPIAFKIKTTAPKQYCVRPNAGRIEPHSEVEIQIQLQPIKEELPDDYKCKDKFLVQTAIIKDTYEIQDITALWSRIETVDKASIFQQKIRCSFLPPENKNTSIPETVSTTEPIASSNPAVTKELAQPEKVILPTPVTTAPSIPPFITPSSSSTTAPVTTRAPTTSVSNVTTQPIPSLPKVEKKVEQLPQQQQINSTEPISDKSAAELKVALEKISLLEKQLAEIKNEQVLRARNKAPTAHPLDAVHQHLAALEKASTEGYPPQIVFAIAALVFIFTYLLF